MELLAVNQPWNLLIFMAIPVILAETVAITELYILFTRNLKGSIRKINKIAGIIAGFYFLIIFLYLFSKAVIPITIAGEWRTIVDVIAVSFYLLGVVPLMGIALLEIGAIWRKKNDEWKLGVHATFVAIFLVVAHIAMIFGMLNPGLLGWGSLMHEM
jgi:phosphatidylglycerophosphate synthase